MDGFFAGTEYTDKPFELFGTAHLIALSLVLLFNLSFILLRKEPDSHLNKWVRFSMAFLLVFNEALWHYWNIRTGQWSVQETLPLHLYSQFVFLSAIMLVTKNYAIYEVAYFLGIGGALQPLITPDAGTWGFPHLRFFQEIISHGLIVSSTVYMTVVQRDRPTWRSLQRVLVGGGLYMAFIFGLNYVLDSNYLFIAHKPATAGLMDMLPDWPVYILFIIAIGIAVFLLLYVPFMIVDARQKRSALRLLQQVTR